MHVLQATACLHTFLRSSKGRELKKTLAGWQSQPPKKIHAGNRHGRGGEVPSSARAEFSQCGESCPFRQAEQSRSLSHRTHRLAMPRVEKKAGTRLLNRQVSGETGYTPLNPWSRFGGSGTQLDKQSCVG